MNRKSINTTIIDDIIEKLQKIKANEKISIASYTRFTDITNEVDSTLNKFESRILSVDSDK